jgi:uncharacterized OB-fold protein
MVGMASCPETRLTDGWLERTSRGTVSDARGSPEELVMAEPTLLDAGMVPPLPAAGPLTAFFWDAVNDHRLAILRCTQCGHYVHYPRPICNLCLGEELEPTDVSGRGTLYAWTVVMQAFHAYFVDKIPYVLAIVELEEQAGLRLTTSLVDCAQDELRTGMPVVVRFAEVAPGVTLPYFRPAGVGA